MAFTATGFADLLTDGNYWLQVLKYLSGLGFGTNSKEAWNELQKMGDHYYSDSYDGTRYSPSTDVGSSLHDILFPSNDLESVDPTGVLDYIQGLMSSVGAENELNREYNSAEAAMQRNWQSAENAINRQWQTDMSNSAYQRMTADLKAAGLNPILAATNGATSTPSGVVGAGSSASYNVGGGDTFSSILSSVGGLASAISQFLPANKTVQVIKSFAKAAK